MAYRIQDYVIRGEIRNGKRNSVSGWLEVLRTEKQGDTETVEPSLVMLSFTGNLGGELEGQAFRFEVREQDIPDPRPVLDKNFRPDQIGAMGDSVFRMVRVPLVSMEEFLKATQRGETPPEEQRASIYLEWYSQNGRVVLELLDPKLEFEGHYVDLADPEPEALPSQDGTDLPGITTIIRNDDGSFEVIPDPGESVESEDPADEEDPFGLFPGNLNEQIRESAMGPESPDDEFSDTEPELTEELPWTDETAATRSWDEAIPGIDPETKALYEQWDEVVHGTKDEPLTWLFDDPLCLPKPDDVRDERHAWEVLNALLSAMALRGVAFDMCPHFTAMRAYRLLIEELLPEAGVHPDLVSTGFVQHYSSWESCADCEAEFEEDYRKRHPKD